jgi:TRAP-type transport system periplasmic protein
VATPDDLRALELFTLAGDPRMTEVWRSAGFRPVPMPSSEIPRALETGRLTALGCLPQVASIARYDRHAKNMTDLPWHLQLGAIVINKPAWDQVPVDARPALQQAAADAGRRLQADIRSGGPRDVAAMRKRGLNVVAVDARTRAQWEELAASLYPKLRGGIVPADAFDEAMRYRDEYRRRVAAHGRR